MRSFRLMLCGLVLSMIAGIARGDEPLLLVGARVLAAHGESFLRGRDVLIENGRIQRIATAGSIELLKDGRRLDLAGHWLIPGLIDLHSHVLLSPYDEMSWNDQVLKEPLELRTVRAVVAGARTIEHGTDASTAVPELMKLRGVVLCPTLAAVEAIARYSGCEPGQLDHVRIANRRAIFRRTLNVGVTIACGSDVGVFAPGQNAREIELMADYGMTPRQALRAATRVAAEVLDASERLGRIEAKLLADPVVLRADPFKGVAGLRSPTLVIREGALVISSVLQRGGEDG